MAAAAAGVRGQQIAFYGSTPAYRKVLELHGWGDLQDELNRLSKEGRWAEMGARRRRHARHVRGGGPPGRGGRRAGRRWGDVRRTP